MNFVAQQWIGTLIIGLFIVFFTDLSADTQKQEVKLFENFKILALKGDLDAQFNLGNCYTKGIGVDPDAAEAAKWFLKASLQGHAKSQLNLGLCFENGTGVPQDYTKAVQWYLKSAEQGNPSAQYNLALRLYKGEGVNKNYVQAVAWFRKAAEQGHALAQNNLGVCFANGDGVAKDEIEAYAYYNLSGIHVESARNNLVVLEKRLSPDARIAGQQRTKQLQKDIEGRLDNLEELRKAVEKANLNKGS